jgi:hypothetical protein
MSDKPIHIDLAELGEIISGLDLGCEKRNLRLKARWWHYLKWWESRAKSAKRKYQWLRGAVVVAGALVPALVGLRELKVWGQYDWGFAVASIVASLVVAICAGLEGLYNFGGIWREKRAAVEFLTSEGFSFINLTGKYKYFLSHAKAYKQFTDNIEGLILQEIKDYIVVVSPTPPGDGRGNQPPLSPTDTTEDSNSPQDGGLKITSSG